MNSNSTGCSLSVISRCISLFIAWLLKKPFTRYRKKVPQMTMPTTLTGNQVPMLHTHHTPTSAKNRIAPT